MNTIDVIRCNCIYNSVGSARPTFAQFLHPQLLKACSEIMTSMPKSNLAYPDTKTMGISIYLAATAPDTIIALRYCVDAHAFYLNYSTCIKHGSQG